MDKKITSSVVLASFATTQFGLLNVSAEHNNSKEDATNNSKKVGEGNKLQSKLGAQNVEKAKGVEDVEKVEKKMANLERSLESKPATYSKVVGIPVVSTDEKSAASKPADDGTKFKKNGTDVATNGKKPVKKAVKLNKPVPHRGKQEDDVGTFGKLKSYLGNMFNFSGKKDNTIGNKKTENKNLKTGTKKAEVKKLPVTEKEKTAVKVEKDEKPEEKTKTVTTPQKAPVVAGKETIKDLQQDKPFSKKISKGSKLFDFAPSKEAKTFLIGTGMLGSAYAADRLVESLKNTAKKGSFIPEGANSQKTSTDESKKAMPGGEFISEVGGELKDNALSYSIRFMFGSDRKIRKSIGDILDSFSKDNVNDLLNCKGEGFKDFSKAVKDFGLGSLSADDLLGKNKKDFLEALKKLSVTDKEIDALLSEESIDKFKNTLQQAGLSAETVEALLGKDFKKFSKLLRNSAIKSDGIYEILVKNFGNFEEEIKDTSWYSETVKYIGRLVLSIPDGFLFWPKLSWLALGRVFKSDLGTLNKVLIAIGFALVFARKIYNYVLSGFEIYKNYKGVLGKEGEWGKEDWLNFRKVLYTDGHIQKLSYDMWLLRHVLRPLLAGQRNSWWENLIYNRLIKDTGGKLELWGSRLLTTAGIIWRLTPISVGWGLLTDWLPSLLKDADTLEADSKKEWEVSDLGRQEKKNNEEKEKEEKEKEEKEKKEKEEEEKKKAEKDKKKKNAEIQKRLKEEKFLEIFLSEFKDLKNKVLESEDKLVRAGVINREGDVLKEKEAQRGWEKGELSFYKERKEILEAMSQLYDRAQSLSKGQQKSLKRYLSKKYSINDVEFLTYVKNKIDNKESLKPRGKTIKKRMQVNVQKKLKSKFFREDSDSFIGGEEIKNYNSGCE